MSLARKGWIDWVVSTGQGLPNSACWRQAAETPRSGIQTTNLMKCADTIQDFPESGDLTVSGIVLI